MTITVIVAAKNESVHIQSALKSILAQTEVDLELVFVDDNSQDNTLLLARELAALHPQLRTHQNPRAGKCSAFNYGVSVATGEYVCIFAGDDLMPPGSLSKRHRAIAPQGQERAVVGLSKLQTMSEDKKFDGHVIPRKVGRGALSGVSPLMNRKALEIIFPVPETLPNEDTWMELAILHHPALEVIHSNIICCLWRVHSGNSINMTESFHSYSKKITLRMKAIAMFGDRFMNELTVEGRREIQRKVRCEESRAAGRMVGIISAGVGPLDILRALSTSNRYLYGVRQRLYGLLSGW